MNAVLMSSALAQCSHTLWGGEIPFPLRGKGGRRRKSVFQIQQCLPPPSDGKGDINIIPYQVIIFRRN